MKNFVFTLMASAIVFVAGCAQQEEISADNSPEKVTVEAGAAKELCFESKKDDVVVFRFEADRALNFNLHYHIDEVVFYPVAEHSTAAEKGQYLIPKDETYCLMWTNENPVEVDLSAEIQGANNLKWY